MKSPPRWPPSPAWRRRRWSLRPLAEMDQIVGFVVPAANQKVEPAQLRQALAARLPHYMVPAHFEIVAELPRLTSGKIDQNALRDLSAEAVAAETGDQTAAPQNEDEAALYAALAKLFPGRALQPEADFFDDLGGHSLLAARLVSILRGDEHYAGVERAGDLSRTPAGRHRPRDGAAAAPRKSRSRHARAPPRRCAAGFFAGWRRRVDHSVCSCCCTSPTGWRRFLFITISPAIQATAFRWRCCIRWRLLCSAQIGNFAVAIAGKWLLAGRLEGRALSAVGRHVFPLVAGEQILRAAGCVSARRHAVDAALSARARRAHRARRDDRHHHAGRAGTADRRGRREHRHFCEHRKCPRRRRLADHRPGASCNAIRSWIRMRCWKTTRGSARRASLCGQSALAAATANSRR